MIVLNKCYCICCWDRLCHVYLIKGRNLYVNASFSASFNIFIQCQCCCTLLSNMVKHLEVKYHLQGHIDGCYERAEASVYSCQVTFWSQVSLCTLQVITIPKSISRVWRLVKVRACCPAPLVSVSRTSPVKSSSYDPLIYLDVHDACVLVFVRATKHSSGMS